MTCLYIDTIYLHIDTMCMHNAGVGGAAVDECWLNGKESINIPPMAGFIGWHVTSGNACFCLFIGEWKDEILFCVSLWLVTKATDICWASATQPAPSGRLGESGTVSSSSHVKGKFVWKNSCKPWPHVLPPSGRGNRRAAGRSRPGFRAIPISLFSTAVDGAVRGAPRDPPRGLLTPGVFSSRGSSRPRALSGHFSPCTHGTLWPSNWLRQVRLVWLISTCEWMRLVWIVCGRQGQGVVG